MGQRRAPGIGIGIAGCGLRVFEAKGLGAVGGFGRVSLGADMGLI